MSLLVGELHGLLTLDDKDFNRGMDNAEHKMKGGESSFNSFKNVGSSAFEKIGSMAAIAGTAIAGAVSVAAGYVAKLGFDFNATMEQSNMAWETLLGGADKAKTMIKDLQTLGANTPFEFEGLDKSAKLLEAMGFQSKDIIPTLTKVGDAVSAVGGGQDVLEGVSMALGQMLTKGKVSAEEMNQLAERGIPAWQLMADKMGMSKQKLMDLSSQGKILSDQAVPALVDALGDKFKGAMDKQSQTWNGMMSTLKDNANMFFGQLMAPAFDKLKKVLPEVISFVSDLSDEFTHGGWDGVLKNFVPPDLEKVIRQAFTIISDVLSELKSAFISNKDTIIGTFKTVWTTMQPLLASIWQIISKVVEGIKLLWNEWGDDIIKVVLIVWNMVVGVIKGALSIINGVLDFFIGLFTGDWKRMGEGLKEIWSGLWGAIGSILSGAWELIKAGLGALWRGLSDWFGNLGHEALEWGKNLVQGFADGINNMRDWIKQKVLDFCGHIGRTVKDFFGIASPSKLMAQYGGYIGDGMAQGIDSKVGLVQASAEAMAQAVEGPLSRAKAAIAEFGPGGTFQQNNGGKGPDSDTLMKLFFGTHTDDSKNLDFITNDQGFSTLKGAVNAEYERLVEKDRASGSHEDIGILMDMAKSNVSNLINGQTPKYHSGGVVTRLGPREVPAILQEGEEVTPEDQRGKRGAVTNYWNVTIPAKDLKEVKDVTDLMARLKMTSRKG